MTAATTARIADAIIETMFAEHELPLADEIYQKYLVTARAAIEAMRSPEADAEQRVIREAMSFDACMSEFEGDLAPCGEHLDALYTACDALRKIRNAAFDNP